MPARKLDLGPVLDAALYGGNSAGASKSEFRVYDVQAFLFAIRVTETAACHTITIPLQRCGCIGKEVR